MDCVKELTYVNKNVGDYVTYVIKMLHNGVIGFSFIQKTETREK